MPTTALGVVSVFLLERLFIDKLLELLCDVALIGAISFCEILDNDVIIYM